MVKCKIIGRERIVLILLVIIISLNSFLAFQINKSISQTTFDSKQVSDESKNVTGLKSSFLKPIKTQIGEISKELDIFEFSRLLQGDADDIGEVVAVDGENNVIIAGTTESDNFPTKDAYNDTYSGGSGLLDLFITKLASNGTIIWSTYFGGMRDDYINGITIDSNNSIILTGYTSSTNFPTFNAYDATHYGGGTDVFISKFHSNGTLLWSTFYGGNGADMAFDLTTDISGNIIITGSTTSTDLSGMTGFNTTINDGWDGFIVKFASNGSKILAGTYLGGQTRDDCYAITLDLDQNIIVAGEAESGFPILNGFDVEHNGLKDAFVTKITFDCSFILWSTFVGGSEYEQGLTLTTDYNNDIIVAGTTNSNDFPTKNAFDDTYAMNTGSPVDGFLSKIANNGSELLWSTYFGGIVTDIINAVSTDEAGSVIITGYTDSDPFPLKNPYKTDYSGYTGFVAQFTQEGNLSWSTVMGGNDILLYDHSIKSGKIITTGYTHNSGFPVTIGSNTTKLQDVIVFSLLNPNGDKDSDTLTNYEEFALNTGIQFYDSDEDRLSDGEEVNIFGTDPLKWDSDDDGFSDKVEIEYGSDPLNASDYLIAPVPQIFIYSTHPNTYNRFEFDSATKQGLSDLGFYIRVEDRTTIPQLNSSHFTNVSQFWIMNGPDGYPFSTNELNVIKTAWRSGMDIVLAGDQTGFYNNVNQIGEWFNVVLEGTYPVGAPQIPIFADHSIWLNVSSLWADGALPNVTISTLSLAQNLSIVNGYIQHAIFENETGTVFWDSSFGHFMDDYYNTYDNGQFVNNLASYLQEPLIKLVGIKNNTVINISTDIELEILDENLKEVKYNWNGEENQTINFPYLISAPELEGIHNLQIYALDDWNWTTYEHYQFERNYAPNIMLTFPMNASFTLSSQIELEFSDFSLNTTWYHWDINLNQTFYSPWMIDIPPTDGTHTLTVYANDSYGETSKKIYLFIYETEYPIINLIFHTNNSIIPIRSTIEFEVSDYSIQRVFYNWDEGGNQTLINPPWTVSTGDDEGVFILNIYANDSANHLTHKQYSFCVNDYPKIQLLLIDNNSVLTEESELIFTITDANLNLTTYQWDTNEIVNLKSPFKINILSEEGWHNLVLTVNDTYGYETTRKYYFYIDTSAPEIIPRFFILNNSAIEPGINWIFDITDPNLKNVTYRWGNSKWEVGNTTITVTTPLNEGWYTLELYAVDELNHTKTIIYQLYVNLPSEIQLLEPLNNSVIRQGTLINITVSDPSVTNVEYTWDEIYFIPIYSPYTLKTSGSGYQILGIRTNDSWGKVTYMEFSFYILRIVSAEVVPSSTPSMIYSSETFQIVVTITNLEEIPLEFVVYIYGKDDLVSENGTVIVINPKQTQILNLTVTPTHASTHELQIEILREEELVYHHIFTFEVIPAWLAPSFLVQNILIPGLIGLVILFIIGLIGFLGYIYMKTDQVIQEQSHSAKGIDIEDVQNKLNFPAVAVRWAIEANEKAIITPEGQIIQKKNRLARLNEELQTGKKPVDLRELAKHYQLAFQEVLDHISTNPWLGLVEETTLFPYTWISQVSEDLLQQQAGSLAQVITKYQLSASLLQQLLERLKQSNELIFSIYSNNSEDIFWIINISEWNEIIKQLNSTGLGYNQYPIKVPIHIWSRVLTNQKIQAINYDNRLYTVQGLKRYAIDHLNEVNDILITLKRQLHQLNLSRPLQLEILQEFRLLLPQEPVFLPYYCQMDAAMIIKETAAYVCTECERYICPRCYNEMQITGMVNCIHCGGELEQRRAIQLEINLERVDSMSGIEFENFLEGLFRTQGYRVEDMQRSGDHGIDLILGKGQKRIGVQVKRHKPEYKIDNDILVKLKGGGYFHDCTELMVVTTSTFTLKAREYAEKVGITLWDRNQIQQYLNQYNQHLRKE